MKNKLAHWMCGGVAALLVGCATLPGTTPFSEEVVTVEGLLAEVQLAEGVLGSINQAGMSAEQRQFAIEMATIQQAVGRAPVSPNNHVELLQDGPLTHEAQLAAIESAQHHIHLEVYILTDDELGQQYADKLSEKAQQGVEVRLMYDSVGGLGASPPYVWQMRQAGVEVLQFNTINPVKDLRVWRFNRRSHRKMLIVDGLVAFTGGINIMDEYGEAPVIGSDEGGWRDTHVRITGNAVDEFQSLFIDNWNKSAKFSDIQNPLSYFRTHNIEGEDLVGVVTNSGTDFLRVIVDHGETTLYKMVGQERDTRHGIYQSYLAAINQSRSRIWITQAYFVPNPDFEKALIAAAKRGVDVQLLLPGSSDVDVVLNASRSAYGDLLDGGVKIFEYQGAMIHSKTAVLDGVWATVGSSNLDYRSFLHNDEANAVVIGKRFASQMEQQFEVDRQQCVEIDPHEWHQRPHMQKLKEWWSSRMKYWI